MILVRLHPFDYGHVGRVDEGVKRVIRPDGPGAVGVGGDPFELDFRATVRLHLLPSLADWIERETSRRLMVALGPSVGTSTSIIRSVNRSNNRSVILSIIRSDIRSVIRSISP